MPFPYDETDAPLLALRKELRRRGIAPGEVVWAISEAPEHKYPGQTMACLKVGGRDASGAIAWTARDAMRDAAWALLEEEGAMDEYTQTAWTTRERWFETLNLTLRTKRIRTGRLDCELQEVESTQRAGCIDYVAVIKVDGVEYMRGGAQTEKRVAKEDAAQALMMDRARLEEMLTTVRNGVVPKSAKPHASSPNQKRNDREQMDSWSPGNGVESMNGWKRTAEKAWSTSSATESEEDQRSKSEKLRASQGVGDDANQEFKLAKPKNKRRTTRSRKERRAAKLAAAK